MALTYGFAKAQLRGITGLRAKRERHEVQYHIHLTLRMPDGDWDVAMNVGTNDADDLLAYKLVYDFHNQAVIDALAAAPEGFNDLTGQAALPALDFQRSPVLAETGAWRRSDVMDGAQSAEPIATLMRLLQRAHSQGLTLYVFGRRYDHGGEGIHDTHMNQGSTGEHYIHRAGDDGNDHNDIWQDGGLLVDLGADGWAAYFAAFEQQAVPTDDLGNPVADARPIDL